MYECIHVMFTTAFIFNKKKILSLEDKNQYTIKKNYVILGLDICIYVQGNIRVRHVYLPSNYKNYSIFIWKNACTKSR